MRKVILMQVAGLTAGLALLLGACGDSHPVAEPSSPAVASAPAGSVPAYASSVGTFGVVAKSAVPQSAEPSGKCNLDAIDGAAPGSKSLPRGRRVLFAGWAASNDGKAVPHVIAIVLRGQRNFAVQTQTGAPRPDVASANGEPGLANSGYMIEADLSAVPPGRYIAELRYTADGRAWRCESTHTVTVK